MRVILQIPFQDFGDNGEVYCTLSDRTVQYVRSNHPDQLKFYEEHFTMLTKEELQLIQEADAAQIKKKWSIPSRLKKWLRRG